MNNLITKTTELALYLARPYIMSALANRTERKSGDIKKTDREILVIDATCGNGHDTLALAEMLFAPSAHSEHVAINDLEADADRLKHLIGIDIQPQAIEATRSRLIEHGYQKELQDGRIQLICGSHEDMQKLLCENGLSASANNHSANANNRDANAHVHDVNAHVSTVKASVILFNLGYLPGGDKTLTTDVDVTMKAVASALDILETGGLVSIVMYSGHEEGAKEKQALVAFASELDSHNYHVAYIGMPNQKNNPPEILLITRK